MCQRPKRAFLISTYYAYGRMVYIYIWCVNAINGLFLFLLYKEEVSAFEESCVNALNGLFLFLQPFIKAEKSDNSVCQRPKRAFLISTFSTLIYRYHCVDWCQRPKRAFLISTN